MFIAGSACSISHLLLRYFLVQQPDRRYRIHEVLKRMIALISWSLGKSRPSARFCPFQCDSKWLAYFFSKQVLD
jgi:hypothetical protein